MAISAINIASDLSEVGKYIDHLATDTTTLRDTLACAINVANGVDLYTDSDTDGASGQILAFAKYSAPSIVETLITDDSCRSIAISGGKKLSSVLVKQGVKSAADTVANLTPVGWAKTAFDSANDVVPVYASILNPLNEKVDYYLTWDGVSLVDVSTIQSPVAIFGYSPQGLTVSFDASPSTYAQDSSPTFTWYVDGQPIEQSKSMIIYDFEASGDYEVSLTLSDDNGNTSTYKQVIHVNAERISVQGEWNYLAESAHCPGKEERGIATWSYFDGRHFLSYVSDNGLEIPDCQYSGAYAIGGSTTGYEADRVISEPTFLNGMQAFFGSTYFIREVEFVNQNTINMEATTNNGKIPFQVVMTRR
ncbi:PKD domain-containing protein [Agarivorans sp. QJM3NY_33]|uniref:PKD domain-containing protein n=1 Tax=Agarivorans sp. QJM3NY_33 TaxID=3421432 RepID=UPI003D7E8750